MAAWDGYACGSTLPTATWHHSRLPGRTVSSRSAGTGWPNHSVTGRSPTWCASTCWSTSGTLPGNARQTSSPERLQVLQVHTHSYDGFGFLIHIVNNTFITWHTRRHDPN